MSCTKSTLRNRLFAILFEDLQETSVYPLKVLGWNVSVRLACRELRQLGFEEEVESCFLNCWFLRKSIYSSHLFHSTCKGPVKPPHCRIESYAECCFS